VTSALRPVRSTPAAEGPGTMEASLTISLPRSECYPFL
jgi:hypothetical protein